LADAAVADATVADATVADATVADAILKIETLAPRHCGPSVSARAKLVAPTYALCSQRVA
jgi:hypothetical protein